MILKITKLPSQILRKPNPDITFPLNKELRTLLVNMLATVKKVDGIGLAAPQVARNLNLAIIYLEHAGVPPFAIINPKILSSSKEKVSIEEGCLSIPGVFGEVIRPKRITFEFQDLEGTKHKLSDNGWIARVVQHEIDHLHQILISDKMTKITQGQELLHEYGITYNN
mgnify:FL=1